MELLTMPAPARKLAPGFGRPEVRRRHRRDSPQAIPRGSGAEGKGNGLATRTAEALVRSIDAALAPR